MPYSIFGTATTGTNSTLRLRGASGWGDWTSAVSTATVDSRPNYYYSYYQKWYHFLTYGAVR